MHGVVDNVEKGMYCMEVKGMYRDVYSVGTC